MPKSMTVQTPDVVGMNYLILPAERDAKLELLDFKTGQVIVYEPPLYLENLVSTEHRKPSLAQALKSQMRELGLTQMPYAEFLHISQASLSNFLRDRYHTPSVRTVDKLAAGLDMSTAEIMDRLQHNATAEEREIHSQWLEIQQSIKAYCDHLLDQSLLEEKKEGLRWLRDVNALLRGLSIDTRGAGRVIAGHLQDVTQSFANPDLELIAYHTLNFEEKVDLALQVFSGSQDVGTLTFHQDQYHRSKGKRSSDLEQAAGIDQVEVAQNWQVSPAAVSSLVDNLSTKLVIPRPAGLYTSES